MHCFLSGKLQDAYRRAKANLETISKKDLGAWWRAKKCDVFIAVHVRPNLEGAMKQHAREAVKSLAAKKSGSGEKVKVCAPEKTITQKEYSELIASAKVVVCPWGMGEWSYCDEHAWLSGSVLVKPRSDYVLTFPDLYRSDELYVAVREDYSDLPQRVREVLAKPEAFRPMAKRALTVLRAHGRAEMAERYWQTVRALYDADGQKPDRAMEENDGATIRKLCNPVAFKQWRMCL